MNGTATAEAERIEQARSFLRLVLRALSCRAAAIAQCSSTEITYTVTTGPMPPVPQAVVREIAGTSQGAIVEPPELGGWSIAGIPLIRHGQEEAVVLVACSQPGDPFDEAHLAALVDLASTARTLNLALPETSPQTSLHALPNRLNALQRLSDLLPAEAPPRALGLLRVDVDHVARLNTQFGWDVADTLIAAVATRIRAAIPADSLIAHFGGGSLGVLMPRDLSATNTRSAVAAILRHMNEPFPVAETLMTLTVSIGWAMFPIDASNAESLVVAAEAAVSQASRNGGGHDQRASEATTQAYRASRTLDQDLAHAIHNNGLHLTWLPTIDTHNETIIAFEALSRWHREGHGPVSPDLFVQCAEEAGLIEALDGWSMTSACKAAMNWPEPLRVCVNISPVWLSNGRLAGLVERVLRETGLEPHRLQIELSEYRPFGSSQIAHQELARVRALGARIALDDFGAGFSSLNRLGTLPIDQIKLDRSFVQRLGDDLRVDEILAATLRLAASLGLSCCAKGVETERQMSFLDAHGCDEVQGFLLGQPIGDRAMAVSTTVAASAA